MKTLYRKGTVHPTPAPAQPPPLTDPLAFLPAAILTLAAALTVEDREVLAYLLSCSSASAATNHQSPNRKKGVNSGAGDHPATFNCNCFRCYMSYWVRWDSSPNRQLIHEIIDAFEDSILAKNRKSSGVAGNRGRRERRKKGVNGRDLAQIDRVSEMGFAQGELGIPEPAENGGDLSGELQGSGGPIDGDKGSVRKLVNFIGERIWNVWG